MMDTEERLEMMADQYRGFMPDNKEKEVDMVNEPPHYMTDKGFECIDVIEVSLGKQGCIDFCLGNALKYLFRCKKKHKNSIEDLKKAKWYIDEANRRLDLLEKYGDD